MPALPKQLAEDFPHQIILGNPGYPLGTFMTIEADMTDKIPPTRILMLARMIAGGQCVLLGGKRMDYTLATSEWLRGQIQLALSSPDGTA